MLPCIDNCCKVDLRTVSFDVPPQEVLTKDSVTVSVDAVVYYRISDPLKAVIQVISSVRYFFQNQKGGKMLKFRIKNSTSGCQLQSFNKTTSSDYIA